MRSAWSFVLLTIVLSLFAMAKAQTSAGHTAMVQIPPVLRLRLTDMPASDRVVEEIRISVEGDVARITPAGTRLQVYANTDWQLLATYAPDRSDDQLATLAWRLTGTGTWTPFTRYPQVLVADRATHRWQSVALDYGLVGTPSPDEEYRGVVIFTLMQP